MMASGKQGNNGVVPESYTCEVKSPVRHLAGSLLKQNKTKQKTLRYIGKYPDAGKDWGQEEKGTTEDEMAGWHH